MIFDYVTKEIHLPNMLLIGSAGRNVGKTTLAVKIIKKLNEMNHHPIITAIKVTTIHDKNARCPRGGDGCGVCSSLISENFKIIEETDILTDKDTSKLLKAGADRVLWLITFESHLKDGIISLLEKVGSNYIIICESNSLRNFVVPGLFFILKDKSTKIFKPSAEKVKHLADKIVNFSNHKLDIDINDIKLQNQKWSLTQK